MTRLEARDVIRTAAEIPGDNTYDYLLNLYLNQELKKFTALRRYPELYVVNVLLVWAQTSQTLGYWATIPTGFQHLDSKNIYFSLATSVDIHDRTNLIHLIPWDRNRNSFSGDPRYFRRITNSSSGVPFVLDITPNTLISSGTQGIYINYWKSTTWSLDTTDFPVPSLEATIIDKVTERIASLQKTGVAAKYAKLAMENYIAARASNIED